MAIVGFTTIRDLAGAELELIPQHELEREFGSAKRRQQFYCGRALLRLLLQEWSGEPAPSHKLSALQSGKPVCLGGPAVSISHAGDLVACCITELGDIGVDLEVIGERRDVSRIAERFFSTTEKNWLAANSEEHFYMLWVLKEAYVKALGTSIFGGLSLLDCTVSPPAISAKATGDEFRDLSLFRNGNVFLALATTEEALREVKFRHWEISADHLVDTDRFSPVASTRTTCQ